MMNLSGFGMHKVLHRFPALCEDRGLGRRRRQIFTAGASVHNLSTAVLARFVMASSVSSYPSLPLD